jgi:tetratricopeptide (TPR) repeat protein
MTIHSDSLRKTVERCRPHLVPAIVLLLLSFAVYGGILDHDFIYNWDDSRYVSENADIQGFGPDRLKAVFSKYYVGNYAPVQMLSYMLDYALWGLWPGGYLLTNLLLHAVNALLLYRLFLQLVGGRLAALTGAALFLVHPVQVESVAWISQRKTLLAMLFFLLAWEFYRAWRREGTARPRLAYGASVIFFLLALLSKSIAVIFPAVLIIFDYCQGEEGRRFLWRDKVPYLVAALAAVAVALLSQTPDTSEWGAGGGRADYHGGSPLATFLSMLPVFCRYLGMIVWPKNLAVLYDVTVHTVPDLTVIAAFCLLSAVGYGFFRLFRHDRRIGFWPLFSLIALLPVAQIIPLVTMMNDRYLYFPLIGIAALAGCGVRFLGQRGVQSRTLSACVAIVLVACAAGARQRTGVWRNALTLWEDASRKSPETALIWESLGQSYQYCNPRPDYEAAIAAYKHAIKLSVGNGLTHYNLGIAYLELNDYINADKILRELLRLSPQNVMGWTAYGDLALQQLQYEEAERRYNKARSIQPEAVQIHRKLGNVMIVTGRLEEAKRVHLQIEGLQGGDDPQNAYDLAKLHAMTGDTGGAIRWLEQALVRGYTNFSGIMSDAELTPVISDARFSELIRKYFPKGG